ncbi:MAG: iron ABC transporter permease [Bacillota bacterium]|nr:iron ABC transporter permease [Bacillota bacterium]
MKNRKKALLLLGYAILTFFLAGYIVVPFFNTLIQAFQTESGYGLQVFREYLSNANQLRVVGNTVLLGLTSVLVCGVIGTALALYMTFMAGREKKAVHILLLSPMMIPGVIIVISFIQLYGESGIVTKALEYLLELPEPPFSFWGFGAIVFVIAYTQYVYFYLNVYVALKYVDYSAIEAARGMGAGLPRVFADVIWPVITPAVLTSAVITFASGISAFSAPNLIGGGFKVLSTQIVRSKANNHMEVASVQVVILFAISVAVILLIQFYSRRYGIGVSGERAAPVIPSVKGKSVFLWLCRAVIALQLILIVLPVLAILYLSFMETQSIMMMIFPHGFTVENYQEIFQNPRALKPLVNSVEMSLMAVGAGLLITVPASYLIVKRRGRYDSIVRLLILLPWTMPASVVAINLINTFNRESIFAFQQPLVGGFLILPIAYTIAALPLLLSSNEVAVRSLSPYLEEASRSLGARMADTFRYVVIPNVAPGIIAGGMLVFIRTIGEHTMSALLYGVYNRPISISMVMNMQDYNIGLSLAYGSIVIVICCLALALLCKLDSKRFL